MKEKKLQKKLNAFIDNELEPLQADQVKNCIQNNAAVRAEYEKLLCVNALLDKQNICVPVTGFLYRLQVKLANKQSNRQHLQVHVNWWAKFAMPAAIFAGLFAGILLGVEIHHVLYDESAQKSEIAQQYLGDNALPVIPDDSITAGYIQLSSQVNR